jgi:rhomboid protease GluP
MGSYPPPPSAGEPKYGSGRESGHESGHELGLASGYGPGHAPEILPPERGYGYAQPEPTPEPPRPRRRGWASAPATYTLIAINCIVFVLMTLSGVSAMSPERWQLLNWGADHAGFVLIYGQWWRIVSAMFVHAGFIHIATNMWCLWNLGLLAEPLMGSWGLIAAYLLTGAAGNLLSTLKSWLDAGPEMVRQTGNYHISVASLPFDQIIGLFPPGVGASGAVFGIAGALIVLLKSDRLPVPPEDLKKLRRSVILFAAINLVIPVAVNFGADVMHAGFQIDYMAHIGGCACGLLLAAPMVPRLGSPRSLFRTRLRTAVGVVTGVLVLFGFFLAQLPR